MPCKDVLELKEAQKNNSSLIVAAEADRRIAPRRQTRYISELIIDINGTAISCMVHNISKTGAMIETSSRNLPNRLILSCEAEKIRRVAKVVWSCGALAGVQFIGSETIN